MAANAAAADCITTSWTHECRWWRQLYGMKLRSHTSNYISHFRLNHLRLLKPALIWCRLSIPVEVNETYSLPCWTRSSQETIHSYSTIEPMDNGSLVVLGMWLRADIYGWLSAQIWFRWKSKSWNEIMFMIDAMLLSNATRWNNHIVPVFHFPIFSLWYSVRPMMIAIACYVELIITTSTTAHWD